MDFDFEKMREVVSETVGCSIDRVVREAELEGDLDIDSLGAMELIMALEEAFGCEISDAELDQFKTIGDLADYLAKQAN